MILGISYREYSEVVSFICNHWALLGMLLSIIGFWNRYRAVRKARVENQKLEEEKKTLIERMHELERTISFNLTNAANYQSVRFHIKLVLSNLDVFVVDTMLGRFFNGRGYNNVFIMHKDFAELIKSLSNPGCETSEVALLLEPEDYEYAVEKLGECCVDIAKLRYKYVVQEPIGEETTYESINSVQAITASIPKKPTEEIPQLPKRRRKRS